MQRLCVQMQLCLALCITVPYQRSSAAFQIFSLLALMMLYSTISRNQKLVFPPFISFVLSILETAKKFRSLISLEP